MGFIKNSIFTVLFFCTLASALNRHKPLIVLSFDGFRADYMGKVPTPNFDTLARDGVTVPYMRPQFTTKTLVNHQSVATGLYAESHGVIDNVLYDPLYNRVLSGFSSYSNEFWNFHDEAVPIWTRNEWAGNGRISAVQFPGCQQHYGRNRTLPTHILNYSGSRSYHDRVDQIISWLTNPTKPANLVFMYFEDLDEAGHSYGPHSSKVNEQISRADSTTGYLIQQLKQKGIFDKVNLVILGDHGMKTVDVGKQYNLQQLTGLGSSSYTKYGGSPVVQILPTQGQDARVFQAFKAASVGRNFQAFTKAEIPDRWHYKNNRRILPMIVVAGSGYVFEDANLQSRRGWHGFDNQDAQMRTIFIASGPAFKKGYKGQVIDNVDLFSLFSNILGFGAAPNNGTFANVSPLLLR